MQHDLEKLAARDLERAIAKDQLELFYQPQVTADGERVAAVEALVRWLHPEAGWISPSAMIPYAEQSGLIEDLGLWVLKRACRDAQLWPAVTVSVNVSPIQFRNAHLVRQVTDCLAAFGVRPEQVELEITESAVFGDQANALAAMNQFREAGIRLALDDFGTGYSSMSYLRSLPWDKVKIDKSFVDDLGLMTSAAIVHAIVALARALGLKVTAEGVETGEQRRFLKLAGCHYLQGYLFSKPISSYALSSFLESWHAPLKLASG